MNTQIYLMRVVRLLTALWLLLLGCIAAPAARARDAAACWARFFQEEGITAPGGDLTTFRYGGHPFHIPRNYLRAGPPRSALGVEDAVRILAWPPNFAPSTPEQLRTWMQGWPPTILITIFGHPGQLTPSQFLDVIIAGESADTSTDERNGLGYRLYRTHPLSPNAELHVSPEPDHFFGCTRDADGIVRNPLCVTHRTLGGALRVQMTFRKAHIPLYPSFDRLLTRMMCCALDPDDAPAAAWPPRECLGRQETSTATP